MGVMLESEIQQGRTMSLGLTDEAKRDRLEIMIGDLVTELGLGLTSGLRGACYRSARLCCSPRSEIPRGSDDNRSLRGVFREEPSLVEEFHQVLTKVDR
jgi:hypothetical protein